jgi:hypothetical protein
MTIKEAIASVITGCSIDDAIEQLLEVGKIDYWSHLKKTGKKVGKVTGKITRGRAPVLNPGGVKLAVKASKRIRRV